MPVPALARPNPRRLFVDAEVAPGTPLILDPGCVNLNIVAQAVGDAGTITIEGAYTNELNDWRYLNNQEGAPMNGISTGGSLAQRTAVLLAPGVQKIRLTAGTNPVRFVGYGY